MLAVIIRAKSDMNIKEIAKEANMSIATVSRVINHLDRVSLATLEKVNQLINNMAICQMLLPEI